MFFVVNMGPYKKKITNDISSETIRTDSLPKSSCMLLWRAMCQICLKNCEIPNFGFDHFFSFSLTWDHKEVKVSNVSP